MLRRFIVVFFVGILCRSAETEKNVWNNEECLTDSDCSGLTSCDSTLGCTLSFPTSVPALFLIFLAFFAIMIAVACLCKRKSGSNRFIFRRNNQQLPPTSSTDEPDWDQQTDAVYTVYAPNWQSNQFYIGSDNPPAFNPYSTENEMNGNQMTTAPYPPPGYK